MPDPTRLNVVVSFGPFHLDLTAGELYRESQRISLQEQPFQVLKMLVDQPGEVLTREYMRRKLWPNGTIVEFDHSINTAVKKLRLALEDSAEEPRYVETLARRGYRLIVPVERLETARPSPNPKMAQRLECEPPAASQTGKRVSHYRVLEVLGGGGMGVVYAAEDIKLGRRVALKFLPQEVGNDPRIRERFETEARAASALNHPNICTIHEFGEHEGQPFIVMELLEGQTLRDRIAEDAGFPIDQLLDLAMQIIHGLEAAHQKGIIHRDIKPGNIFVTHHGSAKILDFGLARLDAAIESAALVKKTESGRSSNLTRTGLAMGTAAYMSPEQVRGEKVDNRTDLFSFGLVLYEMATQKQAFTGDTAAMCHDAILSRTPVSARDLNPELPLQLVKIIDRALQKESGVRYQAASELRVDLIQLRREAQPRSQWARRSIMALCIVSLLAVAGATFWLVKRQTPSFSGLPQLKQKQLTSNPGEDPVLAGEISPDGKYLAYSDGEGIHIKLLATGEIQDIPQPEAFKSKHVDWGVYWLPDSTRVLAGAGVLGQRTSLWTVPVMGGVLAELREDGGDQFAVSPDGSTLAFTTNPGRYFNREIWLMRPSGGHAWRLFDTDENSGFWKIAWSPDGRRLAYVKYREAHNNVQAVIESRDIKGGPPTTILSVAPTEKLRDFLWLQDGRIIYLFAEPDLNLYSCNYWAQHIDSRTGYPRGGLRQLTNWAGFCMDDTSVTADSKQLAFKRWWVQRSVHVADLESRPTRISAPSRLTRSEGNELPMAWTADSQAVVFVSNRTGPWGLFKQSLDKERAEPILRGLENSVVATVSPDGAWVLYVVYPKEDNSSAKPRLFRVPINGGRPQLVLTGRIYGQRCAKSPGTLCAMAEQAPDHREIIFAEFDPLKGRGRELIHFSIDPNAGYAWDLSPDGTHIAIRKSGERQIQVLSLSGAAALKVTAKGWGSLETLDWAADGSGFFCASRTQQSSVLLYVDLQGNTHAVWKREGTLGNESSGTSGIPSPDGRHLAMMGYTLNGNIWTVEGF